MLSKEDWMTEDKDLNDLLKCIKRFVSESKLINKLMCSRPRVVVNEVSGLPQNEEVMFQDILSKIKPVIFDRLNDTDIGIDHFCATNGIRYKKKNNLYTLTYKNLQFYTEVSQ